MRGTVPLKFTSASFGQETLRMCAVHGIDFNEVEAFINRAYLVVEPGSVDMDKVEVGKGRFVENPSRRMDDLVHAAVSGMCYAVGKPLKRLGTDLLEGTGFK